MNVYEISNPSDAYTMLADDEAVASVAVMFLGEGAYGLSDQTGRQVTPIFILGGDPNAWLKEHHKTTIDEVMTNRRGEVAAALHSVLIGNFRDRDEVEDATRNMSPTERAAFLERRHDRRRSSMNDIGKQAAQLAAALRKPRKARVSA